MRSLTALFLAIATLFAAPAVAQVMSVETWVEEWDYSAQQWVRVEEGAQRFVQSHAVPVADGIAKYGPFRVLDDGRAALMDTTDAMSPTYFAAMLRDYPELEMLELIECPGTDDDIANMQVGRMIREAGLATRVPAGGSVRSGAVELFLAGTEQHIDDGAEFAVHSWRDEYGRQPGDFAADAPVNRSYLDYYQEMGMDAGEATAFYNMTNSAPHEQAIWMTAQDMRGWVADAAKPELAPIPLPELPQSAPRLGYAQVAIALDSGVLLP